MNVVKCEKCGVENLCWNIRFNSDESGYHVYKMCGRCWSEWTNNGYGSIWRELYNADNFELANKFILDFLGKLGESDVSKM